MIQERGENGTDPISLRVIFWTCFGSEQPYHKPDYVKLMPWVYADGDDANTAPALLSRCERLIEVLREMDAVALRTHRITALSNVSTEAVKAWIDDKPWDSALHQERLRSLPSFTTPAERDLLLTGFIKAAEVATRRKVPKCEIAKGASADWHAFRNWHAGNLKDDVKAAQRISLLLRFGERNKARPYHRADSR
jgi:hypothetical protein